MPNHLHIVSFDVPFPANYGGVIDVYYKLRWLHKEGVKVHLHCYTYGRKPSPELEKICDTVTYYERKTGILSNLSFLPYTVASRRSVQLENNLLKDGHPILFEVLHTCYLLNDKRFKDRKKIYRHSNIEHDYYRELARSEKSFVKRWYLRVESYRLRRFEGILKHASLILAVNRKDTDYFRSKFPGVKTEYLPSFHANEKMIIKEGRGDYILFHGNLSVSENYEAAAWLIENVFSMLNHRVIIAGLNPASFLYDLIKKYSYISIVPNPSEQEMEGLVHNAQAHVLYTLQPTGLKLKLLNVLFRGRFIICNENMVAGTDLAANEGLIICDSPAGMIQNINQVMTKEFSVNHITEREKLVTIFSNSPNIKKLIALVF